MASPKIIRPTRAASVPVIQPIVAHVEAAATATMPVDCTKVVCLALTFDDGPNPIVTPQVLDILARHNVQATFFLVGSRVSGNEALVQRIYHDGHEIGNHTWDHHDLAGLSPEEVEDEFSRAQNAITSAGVPAPHLFRAPYGAIDPVVRGHIPATVVSWNIDPEDWKTDRPDKIANNVISQAKPGGIVDLHDIHQPTADALETILTGLEQNYHLVTVSELLKLPSGQPGIFYGL
jgi:peptidoglycan/xylan/chitin deacetylase (PgdA/CDA1 family)